MRMRILEVRLCLLGWGCGSLCVVLCLLGWVVFCGQGAKGLEDVGIGGRRREGMGFAVVNRTELVDVVVSFGDSFGWFAFGPWMLWGRLCIAISVPRRASVIVLELFVEI